MPVITSVCVHVLVIKSPCIHGYSLPGPKRARDALIESYLERPSHWNGLLLLSQTLNKGCPTADCAPASRDFGSLVGLEIITPNRHVLNRSIDRILKYWVTYTVSDIGSFCVNSAIMVHVYITHRNSSQLDSFVSLLSLIQPTSYYHPSSLFLQYSCRWFRTSHTKQITHLPFTRARHTILSECSACK